MAVTKATGQVRVESTAVQLVAANANRRSLLLQLETGTEVFLGASAAVTALTGFRILDTDGPFSDAIPTTDAYWAICRSGRNARVTYLEVSDS